LSGNPAHERVFVTTAPGARVKVRIGYGLGVQGVRDATRFGALVDGLEERGFDSLWLSERLTGDAPDPMVGLAFAAGRTRKLKLGTSVQVLPGRNPVIVAKEWASLDRLSSGRTLPAFGLGVTNPAEQQAFGVAREERAPWFDEALPLVRRLWTEDDVDHDGPRFSYRGLSVRPKPVQQPPDVWLGGRAKSELRRVGRLGDGWLPSFSTPGEVAAGRVVVEEAAAETGREIEDEHYGSLVIYVRDEIPELLAAGVKTRRPDVEPSDLVAVGLPALRTRLEQFLEHGFSKLVIVPAHNPSSWAAELDDVAREILPLQT
jgi:probable F420-dependent oxidoreductase